jgi:tRNA pseudouridine38-40 synthase
MVPNGVGTLIYEGCGRLIRVKVKEILPSGDRKRAGVRAPAHGLTLAQVFY